MLPVFPKTKSILLKVFTLWLMFWRGVSGKPMWAFLCASRIVVQTSEASQTILVSRATVIWIVNKRNANCLIFFNLIITSQFLNINFIKRRKGFWQEGEIDPMRIDQEGAAQTGLLWVGHWAKLNRTESKPEPISTIYPLSFCLYSPKHCVK